MCIDCPCKWGSGGWCNDTAYNTQQTDNTAGHTHTDSLCYKLFYTRWDCGIKMFCTGYFWLLWDWYRHRIYLNSNETVPWNILCTGYALKTYNTVWQKALMRRHWTIVHHVRLDEVVCKTVCIRNWLWLIHSFLKCITHVIMLYRSKWNITEEDDEAK